MFAGVDGAAADLSRKRHRQEEHPRYRTQRSLRRKRAERDQAAMVVLHAVSRARRLPVDHLLDPTRGTVKTSEARHLAMYLVHVLVQRTYVEVGRIFGRDRTTVTHACGLIEDKRDDLMFEAFVVALETEILNELAHLADLSDAA